MDPAQTSTPPTSPYEPWNGEVEGIFIAESAGVELHALGSATFVEGSGIEGDRYALGRGHYSHLWHPDRQVTMIAQEVIDEVALAIGQPIAAVELRRNLVTRGVPLNDLVESFFRVGDVILYGGRLNVPCQYLERLIDKPVFKPLVGRSGLNCQIIRGGVVRPGDPVRPVSAEDSDALAPLVAGS